MTYRSGFVNWIKGKDCQILIWYVRDSLTWIFKIPKFMAHPSFGSIANCYNPQLCLIVLF